MRKEFSKQVRRDAFFRAEGKCELCGARLTIGKFAYDHRIADGLGGGPTLENCQCLCLICHKDKSTKHDVPVIAKSKRVSDLHLGIRKRSSFPCSRNSRWKKKLSGEVVER